MSWHANHMVSLFNQLHTTAVERVLVFRVFPMKCTLESRLAGVVYILLVDGVRKLNMQGYTNTCHEQHSDTGCIVMVTNSKRHQYAYGDNCVFVFTVSALIFFFVI